MSPIGPGALLALLLALAPLAHAEATKARRHVELIIDASGSMNAKLASGETRLEGAKKALRDFADKAADDTVVALRAYGHRAAKERHDCRDTQVLTGFADLKSSRARIVDQAQALKALGYTPITHVLTEAAKDFPSPQGENVIVLISDGKETCAGDPCALAQNLAKTQPSLLIHTVGFGVDEAARQQLECVARMSGGKYFDAEDAPRLAEALGKALATAKTRPVEAKGSGILRILGADVAGNRVSRADTGAEVGSLGHTQSSLKLDAGVYNVSIGRAVWRSVEVRKGETTTLKPAILEVRHAESQGHRVLERETGIEQAVVSNTGSVVAVIPGDYDVMFGKLAWPVSLKGGEKTLLDPGVVTVERAHYQGHPIRTAQGEVVASPSNVAAAVALPPGDYSIDLNGTRQRFSLKAGEKLSFKAADKP